MNVSVTTVRKAFFIGFPVPALWTLFDALTDLCRTFWIVAETEKPRTVSMSVRSFRWTAIVSDRQREKILAETGT